MPHSDIQALLSMAEQLARATGRFHPGRAPFSALSRAERAVRDAAREVQAFEQAYGDSSRRSAR